MNVPSLPTVLAALLPLLSTIPGSALAVELPPEGRYRCYEPPSYVVTAWFDLQADGTYRFQGQAPARYSYDPLKRQLRWLDGALAETHAGAIYHAPAAGGTAGQRHTLALQAHAPSRTAAAGECYLTTH